MAVVGMGPMTIKRMLIYGINPVMEALRAGRVTSIRVSPRADDRLTAVVRLAEDKGIPIRRVPPGDLDRAAGDAGPHRRHRHQGVVADASDASTVSVEDLIVQAGGPPLIVVLDGIEDPHNVGAILRTVDAAGADGVVRQARRG